VTGHSDTEPPAPASPGRRRQPGVWPGIRGGVVSSVVIVLAVGLTACGRSGTAPGRSSPGPSASGGSGGLPGSASGPSACVTRDQPAEGSGPWKVVQPKALCGLPADNSPEGTEASQEALSSTKLVFSPVSGQANPGTERSGFAVGYQIPSSYNFERFINVVAFNGRFRPHVAVSELAQLDTGSFHTVPSGPHGGLMECAPSYNNQVCIFGTSATLGQFTIADTLNELTGANTPVNAIRIRDALEGPD
jgi:hypothetical protein